MKVVTPKTVTDQILLTSTVAETDYAEWSNSTAYVSGNKVIVVATHKIYECLINHTNAYPPDNLLGATPKWMEIGATNKWKMFDTFVNSQTENVDGIYVELYASRTDTLALFNVYGSELHAELWSGGAKQDETTIPLIVDTSLSWSDYFFGDISLKNTVLWKYPMTYDSTLKIWINAASGATARCGHCVMGRQQYLGATKFGPQMGILDYSKISTDDFGQTYLRQGNYSKNVKADVFLSPNAVDTVYATLAGLRATPAVYIFNNDEAVSSWESLVVFGYYQNFSQVISGPQEAGFSLEVKGMI